MFNQQKRLVGLLRTHQRCAQLKTSQMKFTQGLIQKRGFTANRVFAKPVDPFTPLVAASILNQEDTKQSRRAKRRKYATWGVGGASLLLLVALFDLFEPLLTQRFIVKMELDDTDEAFSWIMHWLTQHPYTDHCTNITVLSSPYHKGADSFLNAIMQFTMDSSMGEEKGEEERVLFVPGPGRHVLKYKGHLMWIDYVKQKSDDQKKNAKTTLTLTILSTNLFGGRETDSERRKLVTEMISDAKRLYTANKFDKTTIYCPNRSCDQWEEIVRKPKRPVSSVVLQKGETLDMLINDVKQFIDCQEFYESRGIPYRRGYLLYGPPGSGKTSTVQVLAGELGYDIYMLNISSSQMSDEKLNYLMHQAPKKSIVLLEDVDSCSSATSLSESEEEFHAGSYATMGTSSESEKVTVSGLLNAIDGVGAQEGRIVFFTTNHVNRLQKALLRPGRIDLKQEIGFVTPAQAKQLFLMFYKDSDPTNLEKLSEQFVERVSSYSDVTPATLQNLFISHKNQPSDAIQNLSSFISNNNEISE